MKLKKEKEGNACEFCGSTAKKPKGWQKYCSIKCSRHAEIKRSKKHNKNNINYLRMNCAYCGQEFYSRKNTQKYCSKECLDKIGLDKAREWNKKNKREAEFSIFERDGFRCQYCGKTPQDKIKLVIDHIYPISKGGDENHLNLITACSLCNSMKGAKVLQLSMLSYFWNITSKKDIPYTEAFELWKKFQAKRHKS